MKREPAKSIYIHIPFCKSKCYYCAFISFCDKFDKEDNYINTLTREIANSEKSTIDTIYFGGGTPNSLKIQSVEKIFDAVNKNFKINPNAEITIESNPKLSSKSYFKELKNFGVNRISLGIQSFNDKILKSLNRIHTKQDALDTITLLKDIGFKNISIDLIYGMQRMSDLEKDLRLVKTLDLQHISTYGLKIEKGTFFEKHPPALLANEDLNADMYLKISEELEKQGFIHYEISNFAKEGYYSRHNNTYWKAKEYYGFGLAAHGYLNGIRYENKTDFDDYLKNPLEKKSEIQNTRDDLYEEYIMLGLRLKEGIDLKVLEKEFAMDFLKEKNDLIKKFMANGFLEKNKNRVNLTIKGFLISNYIICELLA